CQQGSIWPLTF
nr:immunoglobulin light chain junction region [Macaca mulatta]